MGKHPQAAPSPPLSQTGSDQSQNGMPRHNTSGMPRLRTSTCDCECRRCPRNSTTTTRSHTEKAISKWEWEVGKTAPRMAVFSWIQLCAATQQPGLWILALRCPLLALEQPPLLRNSKAENRIKDNNRCVKIYFPEQSWNAQRELKQCGT